MILALPSAKKLAERFALAREGIPSVDPAPTRTELQLGFGV